MSLDILKQYDSRTAAGILAAAALSRAPDPGLRDSDLVRGFGDQAQQLLGSIREKLKIAPEDRSPMAQKKIDELLNKEMSATLLAGVDTETVLGRAGQFGRLPPALYSVEQSKLFADRYYIWGIKKQNVTDTIKSPDDYQHLLKNETPGADQDVFSLFLKQFSARGHPFWLMVQTLRKGMTQIAQSAWKVFPEHTDLTGASEPIHVLRAFVDAFGLPFKINGEEHMFLEEAIFPLEFAIDIEMPKKDVSVTFSKTTSADGQLKIGLAYCIDRQKYRAALKDLGVLT